MTNKTVVEGAELAALLDGFEDTTLGPRGGLMPHRIGASARAQFDDPFFGMMEQCPAGVVLRLRTEASAVALALSTTTVAIDAGEWPRPGALSVVIEGEQSRRSLPPSDVIVLTEDLQRRRIESHGPGIVTIDLSARADPACPMEIWLPHDRSVELLRLEADGAIEQVTDERFAWIHYGSSISHGITAGVPAETWPNQAAIRKGWNLRNLGLGGNAVLDPFVARMIGRRRADLITLKVGINIVNTDLMRRRVFIPALHGFLDTIRDAHPTTPIVLITAIACPIHENTPGPTISHEGQSAAAHREVELDLGALTLADTRAAIEFVAHSRDDENLHLIDGRELFGPADVGMLNDGLHPTADGLMLIADRFPGVLAGVLPLLT